MGQKINPTNWRLKINETWRSRWFGRGSFASMLHEDLNIRKYLMKDFRTAAISKVEIDRDANKITVGIKTARPGLIIGKGGVGASKIKEGIERLIHGSRVKINIEEIKNPDADAGVIAQNIVLQIEKRIPYRRVMKQAIDKAEQAGVKGIKVQISGRLNGAEIARTEKATFGLVPLSTIKSQIDFAYLPAFTNYGVIGVKVWVYVCKGEIKYDIPNRMDANNLGR